MHDLVALSIINNINLLPSVFNPTSFTIDDLKSRYDPAMSDTLFFVPGQPCLPISRDRGNIARLHGAWQSALTSHWQQYIVHRIEIFFYLLDIKHNSLPHSQFFSDPRTYGLFNSLQEVNAVFAPTPMSRAYERLSTALVDWPIFKGCFYCLILLVCLAGHSLAVAKSGVRPSSSIGMALAAGALLQTWVLLFAAADALFRYLYWPVLASILSLTLLVSGLTSPRYRSARPEVEAQPLQNG
jgi:hypothetical protein